MSVRSERIYGCLFACLIGVGYPMLALGPFLFDSPPPQLAEIMEPEIIAFALFGIWILIVSLFTEAEVIEKAQVTFKGFEALALLYLPYLLYVGTKSICKKLLGWKQNVHR